MTNEDFKDKIKALGYTQASFARRTNIPVRTVQEWAQGRNAIRPVLVAVLTLLEELEAKNGNEA